MDAFGFSFCYDDAESSTEFFDKNHQFWSFVVQFQFFTFTLYKAPDSEPFLQPSQKPPVKTVCLTVSERQRLACLLSVVF